MIVQCPQCQSKYRLEEKFLASQTEVKVRCTKCNIIFPALPGQVAAGRPGEPPVQEATMVSQKGGGPQLPAGQSVALSVTNGPLKGKVFPLSKPRVVLGRQGADITLDDSEVSRKHCALEIHGVLATLVDLGSTNGTFVNEERVETAELEHLSEFRVGGNTLMFTVTKQA